MTKRSKTATKLTASIAWMILVSVCLSITTFAIVYSMVSIDSNLFTTGTVSINLNGGKAIISREEPLLEPGATLKKNFFIENQGSCAVYYKLYFQNASGGLSDVLTVTICDGDRILAQGTPRELTRDAARADDMILGIGEKKALQIYFYFPEGSGNTAQDQSLLFDLAADAVQVKNNPNQEFY